MKPSEDDLRRDLAADLLAFGRAAPGPWSHSPQKGIPGHCYVAQVWDRDGETLAAIEPTDQEEGASAVAAFVAAARDGWPAAVRRALFAEARVKELETENEDLLAEVEELSDETESLRLEIDAMECGPEEGS